MSSPYMMYIFWSENYKLVFNELSALITRKNQINEEVKGWLESPDVHIDTPKYGTRLRYSQQIENEINILKGCANLFPQIKAAYDRYLMHMTIYRDGEIGMLRDEIYYLRLKLKKHGIS